jgi:RNA polymerase sigma-70 factor (ECF subfamily)
LINRALGGDREAFYALVQPCARAIFISAWALLKNDAEAEDAAQEAVLKAFSDLQHCRWDSTFSAWIVQITIDQASMMRRKAGRNYDGLEEHPADDDYTPNNLNGWTEIPVEALQNLQFRTALTKAVSNLDVQSRTVFVLRDCQKFSVADTAKMLRISEADVRTKLGRARLQIRDELAPGMKASWAAQKARSC